MQSGHYKASDCVVTIHEHVCFPEFDQEGVPADNYGAEFWALEPGCCEYKMIGFVPFGKTCFAFNPPKSGSWALKYRVLTKAVQENSSGNVTCYNVGPFSEPKTCTVRLSKPSKPAAPSQSVSCPDCYHLPAIDLITP